ncbi:MAG: tetratricopeptide repeat protein [bacterium]|nr:tetratricopeptide repeat protein [bacterium]
MNQQSNNIPSGIPRWGIICGAVVLVAIPVLLWVFLRDSGERPDPNAAARRAAVQASAQVRELMKDGKFVESAAAIERFLKKYPDVSGMAELWALRIISYRKSNNLTRRLLSMAGVADKFKGCREELCDIAVLLVQHECYQDAANVFKLAERVDSVPSVNECYYAAMCNYRLGRFAQAMKYIDDAAALRPDDPKIRAAVKMIEDARFVTDQQSGE